MVSLGKLSIIYSIGLLLMNLGELGLGPNEGKSATRPTRHQLLNGIDVFQ